jgi:hypothetical protein
VLLSQLPHSRRQGQGERTRGKAQDEGEYEVYRKRQDEGYVSDFDRVLQETKRLEGGAKPKQIGSSSETRRVAKQSRGKKQPRTPTGG